MKQINSILNGQMATLAVFRLQDATAYATMASWHAAPRLFPQQGSIFGKRASRRSRVASTLMTRKFPAARAAAKSQTEFKYAPNPWQGGAHDRTFRRQRHRPACARPMPRAQAINTHTTQRLRRWLCKKHKVPGMGWSRYPDQHLDEHLGLIKLPIRPRSFPWENV